MKDNTMDSQDGLSLRMKVLLVEDNPVERQVISKILRNHDFEVVAVDCGRLVLPSVIDNQPDIILLDALLPDSDGFEVCELVRTHPQSKDLPIIMLTGLDDTESIDRAFQAGATDFFPKPVNHTLLIHRIRYMLRATETTRELLVSQQSLNNAQQLAQLGSWEADMARHRLVISPHLQAMLQLDEDSFDLSALGTSKSPVVQRCHPDDRTKLIEAVRIVREELPEYQFEARFILDDGSERCMDIHLGLVSDKDSRDAHLLGVMLDVTERKRSEQEILRQAYFDRLTQLPNRFLMESYLDYAIPQAHMQGVCVALLALDLDLFNRINNSMGHSAGDAILLQLTGRILAVTGAVDENHLLDELAVHDRVLETSQRDMLARLTADSFVMALPNVSRTDGKVDRLARQIHQLIKEPFEYRGQELFITGSLGVAYSQSGSVTPEMLLQNADLALHEAKSKGRDEICEYNSELVAETSSRLAIQSELKRAMEQDELTLFYQPKICVTTGAVTGFEALVRWIHPEKGMIPPDQFISVAEESGQIVEMGEWILRAACKQNRAWIDGEVTDVRVAVNVSARQFQENNFVEVVETILAETGLPSDRLELEITEGLLMNNADAEARIRELRERGISIALDDFGTGYSSLSYMFRLPIDFVKIDRSFVQNVHFLTEKAAIVKAVTTLSHDLNFSVVAEGVETLEELEKIRELTCDHVQGYLYCKPLPAAEMTDWLKTSQAAEEATNSVN